MGSAQRSSATPSEARAASAGSRVPRHAKAQNVPVILFEGTLTGAGAARILNQQGIRTYSVMNYPGIFRYSRHYNPAPGLPRATSAAEIASVLEALKLSNAVLMPCADDWLRAVGALDGEKSVRFYACVPPLEAIENFVSKQRFARLVQQLGIPHPRTRTISSFEQLQNLTEEDFQGCFLKPENSLEFCRKHGVKALLVRDKASAVTKAKDITFPILLQEYIPGPATAHYFIDGFIDRHGRTCALFARRRLRMYPPKIGNSSLMISIPIAEVQAAADSLSYMLESMAYRGIFSAEFKYDERDGKYKVLEVNARPWWYVEFAARCGVDVCTMAYRDALEMNVTPVFDYRVGRRCVHFSNDVAGYLHHANGFPTSMASWLNSVAGAYDAIFRWSDPGPSIASAFGIISRRWRRP